LTGAASATVGDFNGDRRLDVAAAKYYSNDVVSYFGNLVGDTGDTGDSANSFRVNALDLGAVKRALNSTSTLTGRVDFNRDGRVNALDLSIVKANLKRILSSATPALSRSAPAAAAGALFGGGVVLPLDGGTALPPIRRLLVDLLSK
jgi:hypothetical protein